MTETLMNEKHLQLSMTITVMSICSVYNTSLVSVELVYNSLNKLNLLDSDNYLKMKQILGI